MGTAERSGPLAAFGPATRRWFSASFEAPTPVQAAGWPHIAAGEHALLLAPTGSGKTLAAFLSCLDRLCARAPIDREGIRVVYVSPLKALAYDVERNLRAPLDGIERAARQLGAPVVPPRASIRSGDTSQRERRMQAREPAEILVTTPESLYLILGSQARENLRSVETVIVDEVHALAPTKRGAHLALSLERLAALADGDPQRIGLSATATPVDEVARYLGGDRPVAAVDSSEPPNLDLRIVVPVADMTQPDAPTRDLRGGRSSGAHRAEPRDSKSAPPSRPEPPASKTAPPSRPDEAAPDSAASHGSSTGGSEARAEPEGAGEVPQHGIWPVVVPELTRLVEAHRTTIVFVNSRALCERLVQRIGEHSGDDALVRAHHGSLSQAHRREAEAMLEGGHIKGIVATSSLELGIDMGAVDLVVLVESPSAVARGLQRVGRAGHGVGEVSKGRIFPKHRGDLLEATVVANRMRRGALEPLALPHNPLDVLAQQVVAMCALESQPVAQLERVVRRAASYAELPREAFVGVLDMLSGRYPSADFAELRPRLTWDREADRLTARRGTRMLAIVSGGTIPDRGLYGVHLGVDGARVGELDEEMVHEIQPGHVVTLGASSWRVDAITRDRVIVRPAPGEIGRMPFWRGEGPGRPIELGRALGAFVRKLDETPDTEALTWLERDCHLDPLAAENLLRYLREQRTQTGALPTDRAITVECFRDELGDHRICILTPFGARVHAPWALALEARFGKATGFEVQSMYSDDGICIRIADAEDLPDRPSLFPDPEEVKELVVEQLGHAALFASHFRENAARALLLPRQRPGRRTPLWQQRLKSQQLLKVAQSFPAFPIIVETYRECLKDVFDLPSLRNLLDRIRSGDLQVDETTTTAASPFARSLLFAFTATYLYEGDAPIAERRAQALALDRNLLRELLGEEELRALLDPEVIAALERELQGLAADRKATHPDAVHDLLRRLGAMTEAEVQARATLDVGPVLSELARQRRVISIRIGGERQWAAVEDAALYRDALGIAPPRGVPNAFLAPADHALEALIARWARTHGPFEAESLAARHGLAPAVTSSALRQLESEGRVTRGAFTQGSEAEWCDLEVLRRIKRRTLARLRGEVEPVDRGTFGRFLPAWHGVDAGRKGRARLEETIGQLEGMPLSYAELETAILPARLGDFQPRQLDELGAMGFLVWVGAGALGTRDGKIALFRRSRIGKLLDPPTIDRETLSPLALSIVDHLSSRGACFFAELMEACHPDPDEDDVIAAIWDLVWAGLVTNDTFGPLRALSMRGSKRKRHRAQDMRASGRWSLVSQLLGEVGETERAHARAVMLLERHGIVSRQAAELESLPGGFSSIYPVLRTMEEAGKIRRGYFVEGIGGAQFAFPGAVDRLRAMRDAQTEGRAVVLSASDPASPHGWILPWPPQPDTATRPPKRRTGALLAVVDGSPTSFLDRGGKVLLTFAGVEPGALERGFEALRDHLARRSRRAIHIEQIDGEPALRSAHAPTLRALGLGADHRGLVIERMV